MSPCGRGSGWGRWKGGYLTAFSDCLGLQNCVQRLGLRMASSVGKGLHLVERCRIWYVWLSGGSGPSQLLAVEACVLSGGCVHFSNVYPSSASTGPAVSFETLRSSIRTQMSFLLAQLGSVRDNRRLFGGPLANRGWRVGMVGPQCAADYGAAVAL